MELPDKNRQLLFSFRFIVKQAMTVSLKIRIGDLIAELLAHTFVFLSLANSAGTITALGFKPLFNRFNYLCVRI